MPCTLHCALLAYGVAADCQWSVCCRLQVHLLKQLPTELAIKVLRCVPATLTIQLRQLPQCLSSLAALAACRGLDACYTLPTNCRHTSPDAPVLTLRVDVGQEGDADEAVPAPPQPSSGQDAESLVAQHSSMCVQFDLVSEINENRSPFVLQQRPQVVACPLLLHSPPLHLSLIHI